MSWKTLDDMDLAGKRVLTRVDINVPIANGQVSDATRIERIVPTVKHILAKGGIPVLLAHFGRPKGKVVPEMSLGQLVPALEAAFGARVGFDGSDGDVLLEENWQNSVIFTAMTPFRQPTAPMHPQKRSPSSCLLVPGV